MFGKIAGLLLLRKTLSDSGSLIEGLLAAMAAVIILSLITTVLVGMLILGGLYIGHEILISAGVSPLSTALILEGALLCFILISVLIVMACVRGIRRLPKEIITTKSPVVNKFNELTDAFLSGFNTPSPAAPPPSGPSVPPVH